MVTVCLSVGMVSTRPSPLGEDGGIGILEDVSRRQIVALAQVCIFGLADPVESGQPLGSEPRKLVIRPDEEFATLFENYKNFTSLVPK